jgi:glycosyltransferase involved in cell wall biosynthesis
MAETALEAGYEVTVYARWQEGLPFEEQGPGYRILRAPAVPELAIPGRRGHGRRRVQLARRRAEAMVSAGSAGPTRAPEPPIPARDLAIGDPVERVPRRLRGTPFGRPVRGMRQAIERMRYAIPDPLLVFPLRPMGWAIALDDVAEPADIWHGMWAGSLPALVRMRDRFGGRTVYDSRDVYMRSRGFERMGPLRAPLAALERRWARAADAVLTVNDAYADLLAADFAIERPRVVRNTPRRYTLPDPPPDNLRRRLGVGPEIGIVLYQGGLLTDRGIEQGMEAIRQVPDAIFVVMGVGKPLPRLADRAAAPGLQGRVRFVDPVPPEQLLDWTASADVMLMAIQPTSLNHRYSTPQKLWEAIAAGVPVVASDLPGMADVVRELDCGVLVDPTDPGDIARGIRRVLEAPPEERASMRMRAWRGGQERYNWESEVATLVGLYRELAPPESRSTSAR